MTSSATSLVVLSAATGAPAGQVLLSGQSEDFQLSPLSKLVYASVPGSENQSVASSIAVAYRNREASTLPAVQWPLAPYTRPYASALDAAHSRLLVSVQGTPDMVGDSALPFLLVLNLFDGQVIAALPTAPFCDSVSYDVVLMTIYITCAGNASGGSLFAFQQGFNSSGAEFYSLLGVVTLPDMARMGLWEPVSRTLFVGVPAIPSVTPQQSASLIAFTVPSSVPSSPPNASSANPAEVTTASIVIGIVFIAALLVVVAIAFSRLLLPKRTGSGKPAAPKRGERPEPQVVLFETDDA